MDLVPLAAAGMEETDLAVHLVAWAGVRPFIEQTLLSSQANLTAFADISGARELVVAANYAGGAGIPRFVHQFGASAGVGARR
jgi:hypothetical protein